MSKNAIKNKEFDKSIIERKGFNLPNLYGIMFI